MLSWLVVFVFHFAVVLAQFGIPPIELQALSPKGLRVAITDISGIKLFAFHGKVHFNEEKESVTIKGDVTQPRNGRWIFEDNDIELKPGDQITFWVFVQHNNLGYRKDGQSFDVKELVSSDTPWTIPSGTVSTSNVTPSKRPNCQISNTKINDGESVCRGQLIFEDDFTSLGIDPAKWVIEQRIPSDQQENEFVSYQKHTVEVIDKKIRIEPKLLLLSRNFNVETVESGLLDLTASCTAPTESECRLQAANANILPPVVSGKIATRNLFSFKYGKIEINAKFPQGDWLYPELYLEPSRSKYGTTGYDSGLIRIGFARGNLQLETSPDNKLDNSVLFGGVILSQFEPCRSKTVVKSESTVPWGNSFHTYGIIWTERSITFQVDGKTYGEIVPPKGGFSSLKNETGCSKLFSSSRWKVGTGMAPFDEEFYIALGLGAGGISDFPDNVGNKPWKDKSPKNKKDFSKNYGSWFNEWPTDNKYLYIDSVKVWAL